MMDYYSADVQVEWTESGGGFSSPYWMEFGQARSSFQIHSRLVFTCLKYQSVNYFERKLSYLPLFYMSWAKILTALSQVDT